MAQARQLLFSLAQFVFAGLQPKTGFCDTDAITKLGFCAVGQSKGTGMAETWGLSGMVASPFFNLGSFYFGLRRRIPRPLPSVMDRLPAKCGQASSQVKGGGRERELIASSCHGLPANRHMAVTSNELRDTTPSPPHPPEQYVSGDAWVRTYVGTI